MKLYMFQTVPLSSSGVVHCTHSNGVCQVCWQLVSRIRMELVPSWSCMMYTIAVCTVKNSWWWTEELSKTGRVSFNKHIREISAFSWFYYKQNISYNFKFALNQINLFVLTLYSPNPSPGSPNFLRGHTWAQLWFIQGVTGGTDQTSGECSLGQTIPI